MENLIEQLLAILKPEFREPIPSEDESIFKQEFEKTANEIGINTIETILDLNSIIEVIIKSKKKYAKFCFKESEGNKIDYLIHLSDLEGPGLEINDLFLIIENEKLKSVDFNSFKEGREKFKNGVGKQINNKFMIPNTEIVSYTVNEILLFLLLISISFPNEEFYGIKFLPIFFKNLNNDRYFSRHNRLSFTVHPILIDNSNSKSITTKDTGYDMGTLYP